MNYYADSSFLVSCYLNEVHGGRLAAEARRSALSVWTSTWEEASYCHFCRFPLQDLSVRRYCLTLL